METFIAPALSAFAAVLVPAGVHWLWQKIRALNDENRAYVDRRVTEVEKGLFAHGTQEIILLNRIDNRLDLLNGSVIKLQQQDNVMGERVARIEGRLGLPPHEEPS